METDAYALRPMQEAHTRAVARLHALEAGSFLGSLGPPVLRHFYRAYLDYPEGCAIVARHGAGGPVVGFVVGTENLRTHYRVFLRRRALPMLPALGRRAIRDRDLLLGILRRVGLIAGIARRRPPARDIVSVPPAHLMMVVVRMDHRGRGLGARLVRAFTDEMAGRGVPRLVLGVRAQNLVARRLYERLGWTPLAPEGDDSWLYVRDLAGTRERAGDGAAGEPHGDAGLAADARRGAR
jgi:ribosomal protein S18 acetylase RimI-like enzyme